MLAPLVALQMLLGFDAASAAGAALAVLKDGSAGVCVCVWKIKKCSRTGVVCKHTQKYCGAAEEYAFFHHQVHIYVFFLCVCGR